MSPFPHVDAKVRHRMRVELNKLQRELNTTTIYVTHDYIEGLSLGDRVGVIKEGSLEQVGKPKEIYHRPIDEFVAKHVGFPEINIITADVKSDNETMLLQAQDIRSLSFEPTKKQKDLIRKNGKTAVRIGFRPQSVKIVPKSQEQFIGKVYAFNPFITYGVLMLDVEGVRLNVLTEANKHFDLDEELSVKINSSDLYLFDKDSSKNLEYL